MKKCELYIVNLDDVGACYSGCPEFVCAFATKLEAEEKAKELTANTRNRHIVEILKISRDVLEEVLKNTEIE